MDAWGHHVFAGFSSTVVFSDSWKVEVVDSDGRVLRKDP
jgi:hypothetical protein